jgi:hypothetical protein
MSAITITKRDYNEWLEFCSQVQNSAAVAFNDTEETQKLRIKRALTDYNFLLKPILNYTPMQTAQTFI